MALLPLAIHFGPPLARGEALAFRDVSHYYAPLYAATADRWRHGQLPLWNPLENTGQPLAADSTAAAFYPGQLLFLLFGPLEPTFSIYVVGHLVLAALLMHWSARRFGYSRPAAALAALVYASGGYVLFQYCNLAYLIGAAWLPLAFLAGHQVLRDGDARSSLLLGISLALMVLGGDAQTAYHLLLVLAVYAAYLVCFRRDTSPGRRQVTVALAGVLLAAALAAAQIGPSLEWARHSTRTQHDRPLSLWHLATNVGNARERADRFQGLYASPTPGTHDADIYDFSVGPWRVAELLWPNFSGQFFPTHHRWTRPWFGERRIWNPSLYLGWLPLVLALHVLFSRSAAHQERWWGWLALGCLLAGFGKYGVAWGIETMANWCGQPAVMPGVGAQVGGAYWFLLVLLPGYSSFRYPAKWLLLFSLAISLLAASGLDRLARQRSNVMRGWLLGSFFLSLFALLLLLAFRTTWLDGSLPSTDTIFGPLQTTGVFRDLGRSLLQNMVVSVVALALLLRDPYGSRPGLLATSLLLLTAIDLTVAHHRHVATVPAELAESASQARRLVAERGEQVGPELAHSHWRLYRSNARRWRPPSWAVNSSPQRLEELVVWNRHTLASKYVLRGDSPRIGLVESVGSMQSADYASLLRVARQYGPRRGDGSRELPADVLAILGTRWILSPRDAALDEAWRAAGFQPVPGMERVENAELWWHPNDRPRGWIVQWWERVPPLDDTSPGGRDAWIRRHLFPAGRLRDLKEHAILEGDGAVANDLHEILEGGPPRAGQCRLVSEAPERLEFHVELSRPGLLVIPDPWYPDWECEVFHEDGRRERLPIWQANRTMRAVLLEQPGSQRVVIRYRPRLLLGGLALSLSSWLVLGLWLGKNWLLPRDLRSDTAE